MTIYKLGETHIALDLIVAATLDPGLGENDTHQVKLIPVIGPSFRVIVVRVEIPTDARRPEYVEDFRKNMERAKVQSQLIFNDFLHAWRTCNAPEHVDYPPQVAAGVPRELYENLLGVV
jgi:hypothetical protein